MIKAAARARYTQEAARLVEPGQTNASLRQEEVLAFSGSKRIETWCGHSYPDMPMQEDFSITFG